MQRLYFDKPGFSLLIHFLFSTATKTTQENRTTQDNSSNERGWALNMGFGTGTYIVAI